MSQVRTQHLDTIGQVKVLQKRIFSQVNQFHQLYFLILFARFKTSPWYPGIVVVSDSFFSNFVGFDHRPLELRKMDSDAASQRLCSQK